MKKFLCLLLILSGFRTAAQVSMTVQLPPAGVLLKSQLWNIMLASAAGRSMDVRVTMRLSDARTNQPILTGISRSLTVNKGARQLQAADLMPVHYEYFSSTIDRSANGLLPAGNYLACYSLYIEGDKSGTQPGEDCMPFTVEPVSPPLLNSPADKSELSFSLPQFTWLPPAPLNMFSDLNYDVTLTEVHDHQSPAEAIQQNIPVLRAPGLRNIFMNYPSGGVSLDTGTTYAWSVTARNGNLFVAQTETWTFRVKGADKVIDSAKGAYVQLRKELDGTVVRCGESIQVSYVNETGDSTARYELLALDYTSRTIFTGTISLKRGSNHLDIPLGYRRGLDGNKIYLFRLLNGRNEYWQMKFIRVRKD
ncbi:hypothetical protein HGH93_15610 [Chitinophaga polysaccharea]|uniref:hypothetical protein n=1 Tax=Chitinophaga polysaccharea TaxID=1293035 RepID=UPI001454EC26|nr:hypothetical protein [Chitinophaga polysaccharea]NLR59540.1 hypothetical protein [Chitinophaga polysaccharea]